MYWYLLATLMAGLAAQQPTKIVFPSKTGPVTYDHKAHLKRAKGNCGFCHEKPWPKSTKVPISSKDCRMCHTPGGAAFEMKGNCGRCHTGAAVDEHTAAARP